MFAPKIAKPQAKATEGSTSKLAPHRSMLVGRRLGHDPLGDVLFQRTIGNQATPRLLARQDSSLTESEPRRQDEQEADLASRPTPGISREFSKIPVFPPGRIPQARSSLSPLPSPGVIQAKLAIGPVDDPLEHEADRVKRNGKRDSGISGIGHPGHDFARIPVHSHPLEIPVGRRVHASGAISTRTLLRPHEDSPSTLGREADIYAQGKTPVRFGPRLVAWDAKPLGALETGGHLHEISNKFGPAALERSIRGLAHTRGEGFARSAAEQAGFLPAAHSPEGGPIGQQAADAIRASDATGTLPDDVRERLENASGHEFDRIAIHNDSKAHRAANLLNARAFTMGRDIYFARNEYQPTTAAGMHLLAHEAAHVVQQRGEGTWALNAHARTTGSAGREEEEASHFADCVTGRSTSHQFRLTPSARTGLLRRAISFAHAHDTFTTNNVVANENAARFLLQSDPAPSMRWDTEVTIHGVAGDPFGNFEVGFLQLERVFYVNVHWGSGANHTHRNIRPDAALPRRDATAAANIWYDDGGPSVAAPFGANGDVRAPSFDDTPGTPPFPWDNPIAGRVGNSGWFNYGDAFVTYLSARDTTAGVGAAAFRDIACVYWNLSIGGTFDATRPVGGRVIVTSPGNVNRSGIIAGGSAEFPAMHGGDIANGHDTVTDT